MDLKLPKMAQKLAPAKKIAVIYLQYLQLFASLFTTGMKVFLKCSSVAEDEPVRSNNCCELKCQPLVKNTNIFSFFRDDDGGGCADDDLPGVWLPIFASDQYSGYVPVDMWLCACGHCSKNAIVTVNIAKELPKNQ